METSSIHSAENYHKVLCILGQGHLAAMQV